MSERDGERFRQHQHLLSLTCCPTGKEDNQWMTGFTVRTWERSLAVGWIRLTVALALYH